MPLKEQWGLSVTGTMESASDRYKGKSGDSAFRHGRHRAESPGYLEGCSKTLYCL